MPTLGGSPNRAFTTNVGKIIHEPSAPGEDESKPVVIKVPDGAADLLANGASLTSDTKISLKLRRIIADIPAGCTGVLTIDNNVMHQSTDSQGNVGTLEIDPVGPGFNISNVRVVLTNNAGADRNVRYWLVGST